MNVLMGLFSNIQSLGVFAIFLSVLIVVHEWGHYITAKKLGIDVERFSLGFGPRLFSKMYKGTEFVVSLIPLGGYVKLLGDDRSECKGVKGEFYSASPWRRSLVVLNGPLVNFLFAYICFVFVFMLGYPDFSTKIGGLIDGFPAQEAGLQIGDTVMSVNSVDVGNWTELQKSIGDSTEDQVEVQYMRDDVVATVMVDLKGKEEENIFGQMVKRRLMGVSQSEELISIKVGFFESFGKAFQKEVEIITMTYKSLFYMITGSMNAKESVTGPVGIFYIVKSAAEMGLNHLLLILGVISASLAIFNLLPIIPLDGGHILMFALEKLRGKELSPKVDEFMARLGFGFIMCLALFVFYSDFARFGWIDKALSLFR